MLRQTLFQNNDTKRVAQDKCNDVKISKLYSAYRDDITSTLADF